MIKYLNALLGIFVVCLFISYTWAQIPTFPNNYFQNPLRIPIEFAGNFGELRPNHFHTGLDLKTQQQENLPVYTAASGKVERISISHTGYGNCLYIAHPNGFTTVYAHLNEFSDKIMQYVKQKQLASKSWQQDFEINDTTIVIAQGELIAYSGNTGGSVAPHLHFEIRKTGTDTVYNPMLFGFGVEDSKPPVPYQIAVYNADWSIYMQAPIVVSVIKGDGNQYFIKDAVKVPYERIRIGYTAVDYANNSANTLGVYKIQLQINNKPQLAIVFDHLRFSSNRCINAFADYKSVKTLGKWFQGLYKLPGNQLAIYTFQNGFDGRINLANANQQIQLNLFDFNGNNSSVNFNIAYQQDEKEALNAICNTNNIWQAGQLQTIHKYGMYFNLSKEALYDDVCADVNVAYQANALGFNVQLHHPFVPLHSYQTLGLKIMTPIPFALRQKIVLFHNIKGAHLPGQAAQTAIAAVLEKGYATASIRTLGNYEIGIDTIGPKITLLSAQKYVARGQTIQVLIQEAFTQVQKMEVFINDQWVCFARKGNVFTYKVAKEMQIGPAIMKVRAWDMNQNKSEQQYAININP